MRPATPANSSWVTPIARSCEQPLLRDSPVCHNRRASFPTEAFRLSAATGRAAATQRDSGKHGSKWQISRKSRYWTFRRFCTNFGPSSSQSRSAGLNRLQTKRGDYSDSTIFSRTEFRQTNFRRWAGDRPSWRYGHDCWPSCLNVLSYGRQLSNPPVGSGCPTPGPTIFFYLSPGNPTVRNLPTLKPKALSESTDFLRTSSISSGRPCALLRKLAQTCARFLLSARANT